MPTLHSSAQLSSAPPSRPDSGRHSFILGYDLWPTGEEVGGSAQTNKSILRAYKMLPFKAEACTTKANRLTYKSPRPNRS